MSKDNIVIIGGGIAGMTAASSLLQLGYTPILVEESDHLGGHVAEWNRLFPDMTPAQDVVQRLSAEVSAANVFLSTHVLFINHLRDTYIVMLDNGISIQARAVLLATGFKIFDAARKEEYGYGIYDQVMTNRDLERWLSTGDDPRLNGREIRSAGFVHCVGSRDLKAGNSQCSKVCCVTAIKQAIELKENFPEAEIWCFYMDLRLFGKKYEDFYINAQRDYGIHFIRGRVSEVSETLDGRVRVKAEDTLSGKPVKVTLDLLVLMAGMVCNSEINPFAKALGVDIDSDGFLRSKDNVCNLVSSGRPGLFLAGACTGTKTVPETLAEARSAALAIHLYLNGAQ